MINHVNCYHHTCQHSASIDIEFEKREDLYRILRAKRAKYKKMIGRKEKKEEEKGEKREKGGKRKKEEKKICERRIGFCQRFNEFGKASGGGSGGGPPRRRPQARRAGPEQK